jgi:hypothetical protein
MRVDPWADDLHTDYDAEGFNAALRLTKAERVRA